MFNKFTKGRSLGLIALALMGSFALAGQTWYQVSMSPNDETVTLKNFDGYAAYSWISPLLLVSLAALATTAISANRSRFVSLLVGSVSSMTLTALASISIVNQDLSGVATEIETATGIAATHGITGLDISTRSVGLMSIGVFCLAGLFFVVALISQRSWVAKVPTQERKARKPVKDPISLWDEQR